MSFMQRQITEKMDWLSIDGDDGVISLPLADSGLTVEDVDIMNGRKEFEQVRDFYDYGAIYSVEIVNGHGCRLSAPGYLDCTEWYVFDTEKQCIDYLDEYYPEDEETEED